MTEDDARKLAPKKRARKPGKSSAAEVVTFNGFSFIRSKATKEDRAALERAVRAEFLHWPLRARS